MPKSSPRHSPGVCSSHSSIDRGEGGIGNGSASGCTSALRAWPHPHGVFIIMASGMVRSAAVTFQEERAGLGTSKSDSLVAFCDQFLSTITRSEQDMELFDTFCQDLVKILHIFSTVSSRVKSVDGKKEKIWMK